MSPAPQKRSPESAAETLGSLRRQLGAARPKIQDVAATAGVSLGTVSAVLNGNGRISDATRERVREAIQQLGYRPDLYASNLARRESRVIGVVVSDLRNSFFAETAHALEQEAARYGLQTTLTATNFSPRRHRAAVEQFLNARVAGLAVMTSESDAQARSLVEKSGVRSVFLDVGKPSMHSTVIRVDSRAGIQTAVTHLMDLGHRDLLFVRNSRKGIGQKLLSHKLRDQGLAAAVRRRRDLALAITVVDMHGPGADAGEAAIASVFGKAPFTAVLAITDAVALGVYRGLQVRGVRIPQDISVVGFDNDDFGRFLNPALTTIDIPRAELSRLVVHALREDCANTMLSLPTNLVLRESTAPVSSKCVDAILLNNKSMAHRF